MDDRTVEEEERFSAEMRLGDVGCEPALLGARDTRSLHHLKGRWKGDLRMMACDRKDNCDFYEGLPGKLGIVFFFKTRYCHGPGYRECARYLAMSMSQDVPSDLHPSQTHRVREWASGQTDRTTFLAGS